MAQEFCLNFISKLKEKNQNKNEITLSDACGRFMLEVGQHHNQPDRTITLINNLLKRFRGDLFLSQITKDHIANLVSLKKMESASNATINRYLGMLSAVINRARDVWEFNTPTVKISKFKLKEPVENIKYFKDQKEVDTIASNAAPHLRPIIYAALYTGLRLGNLLNLKWENVDLKHRIISVKVKGNKIHTIPVVDVLMDILQGIEKEAEYVFTFKGKPIKSIKRSWRRAFYKLEKHEDGGKKKSRLVPIEGIPYKNFHTLRHTAATWILKATGNIKLTKDILGHSDIKTTSKYAHILDGEKRSALDAVFAQNLHKKK